MRKIWSIKLHISFIHCGIACNIWKQDSKLGHFCFSHANEAIKWTFQSQIFPPSLYFLLIHTSTQCFLCMLFLLTIRCTHEADLNKLLRGTSPAHHSRWADNPMMDFSCWMENPPSVIPRCVGSLYSPSQAKKWGGWVWPCSSKMEPLSWVYLWSWSFSVSKVWLQQSGNLWPVNAEQQS